MVHSTVNLLGNMAFGKDMFDPHSPAFQEFKDSISKMMVLQELPIWRTISPFFSGWILRVWT
jgi:hypothetical protein